MKVTYTVNGKEVSRGVLWHTISEDKAKQSFELALEMSKYNDKEVYEFFEPFDELDYSFKIDRSTVSYMEIYEWLMKTKGSPEFYVCERLAKDIFLVFTEKDTSLECFEKQNKVEVVTGWLREFYDRLDRAWDYSSYVFDHSGRNKSVEDASDELYFMLLNEMSTLSDLIDKVESKSL